jgi:uncharacterized protein YjiS (DUF1127 family)
MQSLLENRLAAAGQRFAFHRRNIKMLHDLKQQLQKWLRRQRDVARLHRLDDRLLADIGVKREAIAARVYGRSEAPGSGVGLKQEPQKCTPPLRFDPTT